MLPARPSLRLLPFTIALLMALLAAKTFDLVRSVALPHSAPSTFAVQAAEAAPSVVPAPPVNAAQKAPSVSAEQKLPAEPSPQKSPAEPLPVSDAERALLQDLRGRRVELERRDAALVTREQALGAAEQRLTTRLDELTALQTRLEQLDTGRQQHDEANWHGLVKLYEAMKPRDAAAIMNDLDMPVLLPVLDRMKDAKAAAILAAMLPDRARLATTQLAALRTQAITVAPTVPPRSPSGS